MTSVEYQIFGDFGAFLKPGRDVGLPEGASITLVGTKG